MRAILRGATLFSIIVSTASAGETKQATVIYVSGWGNISCGDMLANTRKKVGAESWVLGFVAGVNWKDPAFGGRGTTYDNDALFAWLEKYCRENPLNRVVEGAVALTRELEHRAGQ